MVRPVTVLSIWAVVNVWAGKGGEPDEGRVVSSIPSTTCGNACRSRAQTWLLTPLQRRGRGGFPALGGFIVCRGGFRVARSGREAVNDGVGPQLHHQGVGLSCGLRRGVVMICGIYLGCPLRITAASWSRSVQSSLVDAL